MSSSSIYSVGATLATGTIIAIAVSSIGGLAVCIGIIIIIVCLVKRSNRRRNIAAQGMILQPGQMYPYNTAYTNQYPPNTMSVSNYPPMQQPMGAPNTNQTPNYATPVYT